ncbi:MAG: phosphatase PAP2 family protein [Verrucomicrobia bacterium]|nr:phosphatase PAP2 family protein [Verrucomicrobiota bacterium]
MWLLLFFLTIIASFYLDKSLLLALTPDTYLFKISFLLEKAFTPLLYPLLGAFLFLASYKVFFLKNRRELLLEGTITTSLIYCVTGFLKVVMARARPTLFLEEGVYGFFFPVYADLYRSFPSSHMAMAFGLFMLLLHKKKISWLWVLLPMAVGISRLVLQKHFVSDVLAGAFIGILCALIAERARKLLAHLKLFQV